MKEGKNFEILDQYDYVDQEYIQKVSGIYSRLIGGYLINFSALEHDLNIIIAEILNDRTHEVGYQVIDTLQMKSKIELFYKLSLHLSTFLKKGFNVKLKNIKKRLVDANTFRNTIAHANWTTLNKKGFVRSKVIVDNEEGFIKFRLIKILPKDITKAIKIVEVLDEDLVTFAENINQALSS